MVDLPTSSGLPSMRRSTQRDPNQGNASLTGSHRPCRHGNDHPILDHGKDTRVKQMNTSLAASITKTASKQTYFTIRFLADRDRLKEAFLSYAYFRWVDDVLDAVAGSGIASGQAGASERTAFLKRQKTLLENCLQGENPRDVNLQEKMLVELVRANGEKDSGLRTYLHNMMQVMEFDAMRRGRLITQAELKEYTRWLAVAVTENLHHFIGHGQFAPRDERRYMAVSAAHITHMLRDTYDDVAAGYYNIPREVLDANHIGPEDVHNPAYRTWVQSRVSLARAYFEAGRRYFARVQNRRCRLACFAYIARFDWLLDTFEREGFLLRPQYDERKSPGTGLRMLWRAFTFTLRLRGTDELYQPVASHRLGKS
jgi:phytoene/squalene synthetase